jgi:tetraacyldisaccharide 4'-kinase
MIKLYYPKFWQKKSLLSYILLPLGLVFLLLGYIRKCIVKPIKFPAFTICVGNVTIGGTGKTQIIITLAKEFVKRNINFIIFSKGYKGNCSGPALVTASSSAEEVGDEALELCRYGNSFVLPKMEDALPIIAKYKPDVILVDDGMQNPAFQKDLLIMTIDGSRGFGNGFPIPAGPMRSLAEDGIEDADIIVINGESETNLELDRRKQVFKADLAANHNFGTNKYYAFAGIGNPEKFFSFLKNLGAKLGYTKIFPDHYKYSVEDIEDLVEEAKKKNLRLITTRKDYVKIQTPKFNSKIPLIPALQFVGAIKDNEKNEISQLEYLEVELKLENSEKFFELIFSKYDRYNLNNKTHEKTNS